MSNYHEPVELLNEKTRNITRAINSLKEELEAVDWYNQRVEASSDEELKAGADYFTTTLTISPLKNAAKINEIGQQLSEELEVPFLPSDFKKKNGYKRSVELSKEYDLYRQDYCGCIFSKAEREEHEKAEIRLE